jgi:tRNA wybutosine-synthesizing protein 3
VFLQESALQLSQEKQDLLLDENQAHPASESSEDSLAMKGRGGGWLVVSHSKIEPAILVEQLKKALQEAEPSATALTTFKFEPFLLHVECRSIEQAQTLLQLSIAAGLR